MYKSKIQSDGILDKLRLRIVVRWELQNTEIIGDTWYKTASKMTLKYFLENSKEALIKSTPIGFHWITYSGRCKTQNVLKLDRKYGDY